MSKAAELAALIGSQTAQSNRNLIINGAMRVAQRGTSVDSSSGSVVRCVDRYRCFARGAGAATFTQSTTVPTGEGFANSLKVDVTTVDSSLTSNDLYIIDQRIEAQNLQQLAKGTSTAKLVTASFWVRSTKTGTYVLELFDDDNSRHISKTYTISSADTWEHKTITFEGDTTGALNNDTGIGFDLRWFLGAGPSYTSGTLATSWQADDTEDRAVGQVNFFDSTSNNYYLTGVQLEVGEVATPFEHLSFADDLALCKRYFETSYPHGTAPGSASGGIGSDHRYVGRNTPQNYGWYSQRYTVEKRAAPTVTIFGYDGTSGQVSNGDDGSNIGAAGVIQNGTTGFLPRNESGGTLNEQTVIFLYSADAEL